MTPSWLVALLLAFIHGEDLNRTRVRQVYPKAAAVFLDGGWSIKKYPTRYLIRRDRHTEAEAWAEAWGYVRETEASSGS